MEVLLNDFGQFVSRWMTKLDMKTLDYCRINMSRNQNSIVLLSSKWVNMFDNYDAGRIYFQEALSKKVIQKF